MAEPRLVPLPGVDPGLRPDTVATPEIHYSGIPTVAWVNAEGLHIRASFERWDALRVSRGEHPPYRAVENMPHPEGWTSIHTVFDSPWLAERYAYEKQHYGAAYGFGGNVDEMLTDFEHYVLRFHDEFVEVIAGGIWLEHSKTPFVQGEFSEDHPLLGIGATDLTETFVHAGVECVIRSTSVPVETVRRRALLCAQPIVSLGFRLPNERKTAGGATLSLRIRGTSPVYILRNSLGTEVQRTDVEPDRETLKARLVAYVDQVLERRRARGL